ncbi:MAG: hypothetical protein KatS3mg051_0708 [Anaerolineae bacterium]|nr:MAG: hypothetical protein KatS3mg051_0708 [Anaerolineae bacterium]
MPTIVFVILLGLLGGMAVALQGPLVSMMTVRLGLLESMFIIQFGGTVAVAVPLLLRGGGALGNYRSVPWYALISGVSGLVILSAISYTIPRVGTVATVTLVVAGQLVLSVILDHFGVFGLAVRHLDLQRLIGLIVLFVGVWLTVR